MAYEINLWDRINMPGREIGTFVRDILPKEGDFITPVELPRPLGGNYQLLVLHIWRTGAKIEDPERYTAIVKKV